MAFVSSTVVRELTMELMAPTHEPLALPAVMRYDTADPYAVCVEFQTGTDEGVPWVFARELMSLGLGRPTGDGDVRIWPSSCAARSVVRIGLNSPDGEAVLQVPTADVADFLDSSYALCPQGREGDYLDLDVAVKSLLA